VTERKGGKGEERRGKGKEQERRERRGKEGKKGGERKEEGGGNGGKREADDKRSRKDENYLGENGRMEQIKTGISMRY
jgi:hypothetical protein